MHQIVCILHAGMMDTSDVTILLTPRLDRAPRTRPQVKARYWREGHLCHLRNRDGFTLIMLVDETRFICKPTLTSTAETR